MRVTLIISFLFSDDLTILTLAISSSAFALVVIMICAGAVYFIHLRCFSSPPEEQNEYDLEREVEELISGGAAGERWGRRKKVFIL